MPRDVPESWHDKAIPALITQFATDVLRGLAPEEAVARLQQWGANALRQGKTVSALGILAGQFRTHH
jgi:hypothetical protein